MESKMADVLLEVHSRRKHSPQCQWVSDRQKRDRVGVAIGICRLPGSWDKDLVRVQSSEFTEVQTGRMAVG